MARNIHKKPSPKEHIERVLSKLGQEDVLYRVSATDIPRDAYALLLFGLAGGCTIERITETKFQIHSGKAQGKRFTVTSESMFRKSYNHMLKSLEPSPERRKDFMTTMEKYAEACLSKADSHRETDDFLPLKADNTSLAEESGKDEGNTSRLPQMLLGSTPLIGEEGSEIGISESKRDASSVAHVTPISPTAPLPSTSVRASKIVNVEPFQAKHYQTKEHGVKRDSELINVITYDDGTDAFQCVICEYTSENQASLNGHMGSHSKEERELAKRKPALHRTEKWTPTSNQRTRITHLANEIAKAMSLGLTSPEAIASAIIEARAHAPQSSYERDELEYAEMTPEQQLQAIRRILGADRAVKAVQDQQEKVIGGLQDQIDSVRAEMEQIRKDRDIAKKELADFKTWYNNSPVKN